MSQDTDLLEEFRNGIKFSTGIAVGDTDTTAVAVGDVVATLLYV